MIPLYRLSAYLALAALTTTTLANCAPLRTGIFAATDGINTYRFNLGPNKKGQQKGVYVMTLVDGRGAKTMKCAVTIANGKADLSSGDAPCAIWTITSTDRNGFRVRAGTATALFRLSDEAAVRRMTRQTAVYGAKYHFVIFPKLESPFNQPCVSAR